MRVGSLVRSGSGQPAPRPSLGSCSADCQLSWQPDLPEAHTAKCHITPGSAPARNHFHTHTPPTPAIDNTWKWELFDCLSLFLQCTESRKNKMLSLHTLPPPGDHKYLFYKSKALLQLHIPMTRANFSDAYLSLILCAPGSLQSKSFFCSVQLLRH